MVISCGFIVKNEDKILICHPSPSHKRDDFWDLPKGRMEEGENHFETALRETEEETGLNLMEIKGKFSFIGSFSYPSRSKKLFVYYFESRKDLSDIKLVCNSRIKDGKLKGLKEHDRFKWVKPKVAIRMLHETAAAAVKVMVEKF